MLHGFSQRSETPGAHLDLPSLCSNIVYASPFPIAAFQDAKLLHANNSFCRLAGDKESSLRGRSLSQCLPAFQDGIALLSRVSESGIPEEGYAQSWPFAAWPIRAIEAARNVIVLQITRTSELHRSIAEALLVTAVQQHEETEIARASAESMGKAMVHQEEELDHTKEEMRSLASQLLQAQEEERRRIARELHDGFSQQLAFLGMQLSHLEGNLIDETNRSALAKIHEQVDALSSEIRVFSHKLHSSALEDLGLAVALRSLLQDFENVHNLPVRLIASGGLARVPLPVATALFRIVQESLWNVVKHAGQESGVTVSLSQELGLLTLSVEDTGIGFDLPGKRGLGGLGLISMGERARAVGGAMKVISSPGEGTTVQVTVALPEASTEEIDGQRAELA